MAEKPDSPLKSIFSKASAEGGFTRPHRPRTPDRGKNPRFDFPEHRTEAVVLKPELTKKSAILFLLLFGTIWNGIVSVFVVVLIKSFLEGKPEWFMLFFLIPFVLIGIGIIFILGYYILALFNPKLELTCRPGQPALGERFQVSWRVNGNVNRLQSLKLVLEAEEVARYMRGTTTVTDRNTFEQVLLADQSQDVATDYSGNVELTIPPGSMHSFKGRNNEIIWSIKAEGKIARWPNITNNFLLLVAPRRPR